MLVLLGSLVHTVVVWARQWLTLNLRRPLGILRMVRDVVHVSGLLRFDASGSLVEILLNHSTRLAHRLIPPLRELLAPSCMVVNLGET
jgi:hypothetical protein